jgi:hypothetical protein
MTTGDWIVVVVVIFFLLFGSPLKIGEAMLKPFERSPRPLSKDEIEVQMYLEYPDLVLPRNTAQAQHFASAAKVERQANYDNHLRMTAGHGDRDVYRYDGKGFVIGWQTLVTDMNGKEVVTRTSEKDGYLDVLER